MFHRKTVYANILKRFVEKYILRTLSFKSHKKILKTLKDIPKKNFLKSENLEEIWDQIQDLRIEIQNRNQNIKKLETNLKIYIFKKCQKFHLGSFEGHLGVVWGSFVGHLRVIQWRFEGRFESHLRVAWVVIWGSFAVNLISFGESLSVRTREEELSINACSWLNNFGGFLRS